MTLLDELIDEYIAWESNQRPRLGYPRSAAGMSRAGSNRSHQSAEETLDESAHAIRMAGVSGAWESMTVRQERALRADATNRRSRVTVWHIPGLSPAETAREVELAKSVLLALARKRNVLV